MLTLSLIECMIIFQTLYHYCSSPSVKLLKAEDHSQLTVIYSDPILDFLNGSFVFSNQRSLNKESIPRFVSKSAIFDYDEAFPHEPLAHFTNDPGL